MLSITKPGSSLMPSSNNTKYILQRDYLLIFLKLKKKKSKFKKPTVLKSCKLTVFLSCKILRYDLSFKLLSGPQTFLAPGTGFEKDKGWGGGAEGRGSRSSFPGHSPPVVRPVSNRPWPVPRTSQRRAGGRQTQTTALTNH